jgi:hypothetical protein
MYMGVEMVNSKGYPRVLVSSYEWALMSGVFSGTVDDYIELQHAAYRLMCYKYECEPKTYQDWLNAYREVKHVSH